MRLDLHFWVQMRLNVENGGLENNAADVLCAV